MRYLEKYNVSRETYEEVRRNPGFFLGQISTLPYGKMEYGYLPYIKMCYNVSTECET